LPHIDVDPETFEVRVDGIRLTRVSTGALPPGQRYLLY
jgi:urease alpha subunit